MGSVTESSEAGSSQASTSMLAESDVDLSDHKKRSRPKSIYQVARPASNVGLKCMCLRQKLLLQIQQLSQTNRPLPILEILPSRKYVPCRARKSSALFRRKKSFGPNDFVITTSEYCSPAAAESRDACQFTDSGDEYHRSVVATISTATMQLRGDALICLDSGPIWESKNTAGGSYEFVTHSEHGVQVVRWALRSQRKRPVSSLAPSTPQQPFEGGKRFTFSILDPRTRRHPVIASMTGNILEVYHEYTATDGPTFMPRPSSPTPTQIDDHSVNRRLNAKGLVILDDKLHSFIVITAIWVALCEDLFPGSVS
ncbi:hypothetical protein ASPVEDRAFT_73114 [Aspergillus versicolor CBS 583.65]|uniref:Uncharacterized protein n=1 Tax=Aspergillus versicolor CBS 583.65 TaxID=1036611 RepID=A0A1L9PPG4_ASPVE|nr:uncharacterized protein ASPVEDRAFT_73114 [Aspergillus versicolor CBS 583.65]OJJ03424.1 hypothetical protein ASPVEDRAFT_73114 [Aspergillus versicolor CBS 583.65]